MSESTAYPPAPEFDDVSPRELDHNGVEYWKRIAKKWERTSRRNYAECLQSRATINALNATVQMLTKKPTPKEVHHD